MKAEKEGIGPAEEKRKHPGQKMLLLGGSGAGRVTAEEGAMVGIALELLLVGKWGRRDRLSRPLGNQGRNTWEKALEKGLGCKPGGGQTMR